MIRVLLYMGSIVKKKKVVRLTRTYLVFEFCFQWYRMEIIINDIIEILASFRLLYVCIIESIIATVEDLLSPWSNVMKRQLLFLKAKPKWMLMRIGCFMSINLPTTLNYIPHYTLSKKKGKRKISAQF